MAAARAGVVPATAAAAVETAKAGATAPTKAAEMAGVTTETAEWDPAMKSAGHGAEARAVKVNARVAAPESTAEQLPADPQTPQVKTD
jgi:hypothetical protein